MNDLTELVDLLKVKIREDAKIIESQAVEIKRLRRYEEWFRLCAELINEELPKNWEKM